MTEPPKLCPKSGPGSLCYLLVFFSSTSSLHNQVDSAGISCLVQQIYPFGNSAVSKSENRVFLLQLAKGPANVSFICSYCIIENLSQSYPCLLYQMRSQMYYWSVTARYFTQSETSAEKPLLCMENTKVLIQGFKLSPLVYTLFLKLTNLFALLRTETKPWKESVSTRLH